jgi:hypothetical protein
VLVSAALAIRSFQGPPAPVGRNRTLMLGSVLVAVILTASAVPAVVAISAPLASTPAALPVWPALTLTARAATPLAALIVPVDTSSRVAYA